VRPRVPGFSPWIVIGALLLAACYQQPALSPQRPLRCSPSETRDECPKGYACQGGVCGPTSCQHSTDCPAGLSCTNRGCVLPPDAGDADGGLQIPADRDANALEVGIPDVAPAPEAGVDAPALVDGGQD
jgi:hypothetical protein